jgi:hypothetical protein
MLKRGLTITAVAAAPAGVPHSLWGEPIVPVPGIQLYTIRDISGEIADISGRALLPSSLDRAQKGEGWQPSSGER